MNGSKSEGEKGLCNYISNSITNIDVNIQKFLKARLLWDTTKKVTKIATI